MSPDRGGYLRSRRRQGLPRGRISMGSATTCDLWFHRDHVWHSAKHCVATPNIEMRKVPGLWVARICSRLIPERMRLESCLIHQR